MDSPRSEKMGTRYSTPVSDLDDHRYQEAIPPADLENHTRKENMVRRGTAGTIQSIRPVITLQTPSKEFLHQNTISRDFEQAIVDEDLHCDARIASGGLDGSGALSQRRVSPISHRPVVVSPVHRERSLASRSPSPPNSVDAFAEPRRRERGNTFGSKVPSDLNLSLHRTISGGTHRCRPTLNEGSVRDGPAVHDDSARPEEDVCFPQETQPTKSFTIDYEEIDEFVAQSRQGRPIRECQQTHSFDSCANIAIPLTQRNRTPQVAGRSMCCKEGSAMPLDSSDEKLDEKLNEKLNDSHSGNRLNVMSENRFSFFSSEMEQTIHAPEVGDLVLPGESFRDLFELPSENGTWWLDVLNPTEDEMEMFQKAFGIHRLTAEDIEKQEMREKVELFKQYYFVCFRSFAQMDKNSDNYLEPVNVYMVVFREGILTFMYAQGPHAAEVRKRIGKLRNYINLTADWICYALVDNIVDCFEPVIRTIDIETDQIEDQVFVARAEDSLSLLKQIGECRKKVTSLMRLLGGKADVIKGFAKRCNEQYSVTPRGEIGLYLGDIQDHVVTMMSNLGAFEKMLSRSHSNYLAQLSVDSIMQGNRANQVLSKITIIATILVPLNLICGLFGMNVKVPWREQDDLTAFFGILGLIVGTVLVSLVAAKRFKYI